MDDFLDVMSDWATGVAVLASHFDGEDIATTTTSFTPVSLSPPIISVSLMADTYPAEVLDSHPEFTVTVLAASQRLVASRAANPGRPHARLLLADHSTHRGAQSRALIIDHGVVGLEARVVNGHTIGDHRLFLAEVHAVDYLNRDAIPLIRYQGRYRKLQ